MVGASFSRVRPSENRSGERPRTATARKIGKNRFRRRLRTHFFAPAPVFGRFWGPGRVPKSSQSQPRAENYLVLEHTFVHFLAWCSPGRVPEGSRTDSGDPGDPPEHNSGRIFRWFLARSFGVSRMSAGSAGVLPGYTANLRNSLSGVPPGVRRSRAAI